MNIVLWILAGGVVGWAAITYMGFNEMRGVMISVVIGMAGGLIGGQVLAPMLGAAASVPGDFSLTVLIVALASSAACLAAANKIYDRFGF